MGKAFVAPNQAFPVLEVTYMGKEQQQALRSWNNRAGHGSNCEMVVSIYSFSSSCHGGNKPRSDASVHSRCIILHRIVEYLD
jgi:hypothetical protein